MSPVRPWFSLVRFEEYGPLFLLCGVTGAAATGVRSWLGLLGLLAFIGCFSASAFVLNDVADWREDSTLPRPRNPISRGLLSRSSAICFFALLAALSLASLALVGAPALYAAPLVYGLYWGYSWGPQFKAREGLDIIVHGSVPAVFVFMGSALGAFPPARGFLLAGVVFCFAAMSGLLQEVRDMEKDASFRRTTALSLGTGKSLDFASGLLLTGTSIFIFAAATGAIPLPLLGLAPLTYLLYSPIRELKAARTEPSEAIRRVRARGLVLTGVVLASYMALALHVL